ncbi:MULTISPECIES: histidine--tRNA ligase [Candidatus Phytoplasma]|uniref:Histidine--tRNA ligase n=2 Tax=Candidatus Phytoplasma TaxID=33926 RepID=A0ABN0J7N9_PEWBP|nr:MULTISPECIES: histidine--tRNA ligase [Phytoplasma]EMR14469.1 histidyl-tRNA synthetase [Peanut witches'-broom phytoplasma NTU2011]MDO8052707.1 histidine--tRNA ligase ['Vigna radiata' phytoplasma]WKV64065.1 MAG: histidyl-tRNA synthetase [Candidatus Phytoplasma australasiaticum]
MNIKKIKGTKDFFQEEMLHLQFIEKNLKKIIEKYHFQEIRTPILEYHDIFYHATPQSEMVNKETYQFLDKKGRKIVLRPEGTAGIVRSYLENKLYNFDDIYKFYYCGPFFRYERPQYGRYRQFHQIGIEMLGNYYDLSELEIFCLVNEILIFFNLPQAKIKINHLGNAQTRQNFIKIFSDYLQNFSSDLCPLCLKRKQFNILRIFDCKICQNKIFLKKAPLILNFLDSSIKHQFEIFLSSLKKENINFCVDPTLVRGLDYYTDIVFEIALSIPNEEPFELILGGGGNYNDLIYHFESKKKIKAIGFAIGIERLMLALQYNNFWQNIDYKSLDVCVLSVDYSVNYESFRLIQKLRQNNINAEVIYNTDGLNLTKCIKKALKLKPNYLIFIGAKELKENFLTVKNTTTKIIYNVNLKNIITFLKKELTLQS